MELKYIYSPMKEDDAQIEKKHEPHHSRVSGYVSKVYIKDNNFVKKGDTFTMTQTVKLKEATANLAAAEGNLRFLKQTSIHFS
jgi:membrane fusion protein (multidrug efflux system)